MKLTDQELQEETRIVELICDSFHPSFKYVAQELVDACSSQASFCTVSFRKLYLICKELENSARTTNLMEDIISRENYSLKFSSIREMILCGTVLGSCPTAKRWGYEIDGILAYKNLMKPSHRVLCLIIQNLIEEYHQYESWGF